VVLIIVGRLLGLLSRLAPEVSARIALWLTRRTRRGNARRGFGREIARHRVGSGEVVLHSFALNRGGPRVLLVHGWNAAADHWAPMAAALTARGLDVLAVDLPGHGATRGRASSLPRFVRALERIEREHGPFDAWIGHSMGANAALASLARGARARRLVLIGPLVRPAWALRGFARGFGLTAAATRAYLRVIEQAEAMPLAAVDAERNAAQVDAPTLLVHDLDDRVIPIDHVEALLRVLPAARLLLTRGLGHRRVLADAEVARKVSDFVADAA
jgi:pimeloyl-ACP methyl ester carboxylesterase